MAFTYTISIVGQDVSTRIDECDVMREGNRCYIRVPGVHGWVVRPASDVFDSKADCEAALARRLLALSENAHRAVEAHYANPGCEAFN